MSRTATETSSASKSSTLEVVFFVAGGHRFAVEAAQVRTQLPAAQSATVLTAEQLLGLPDGNTQPPGFRRILLIKHSAGDYAVSVSDPVELRSLEIDSIFPLPFLIAARNSLVGIRGLAVGKEGVTVLVDLRAAKPPEE
jgi:hypothetical protein